MPDAPLKATDFRPVPGEPTQWRNARGLVICGRRGQQLAALIAELNAEAARAAGEEQP